MSGEGPEAEHNGTMMGVRRSVVFRLTFVRHGETRANKERRIQGHSDIPLSEDGERQATKAGESLRDVSFTRVYASDLCRASATCRHILDSNTRHPPPILIDTRLRERNFGTVEGLCIDEALSMAAAEGSSWPHYTPPGAETLGDLSVRMVAFFKAVCQSVYDKNNNTKSKAEEEVLGGEANHKVDEKEGVDTVEEVDGGEGMEHVLVVSHGAALRQMYTHLHRTLACPLPPTLTQDAVTRLTPNTAISEYTVRYSPKTYTVQCVRLHDDQHLHSA